MLRRTLGTYLRRDAGYYPVVTLTGPRQSGKATLTRTTFPDFDYVNLEDAESRHFARGDPHGFLHLYRPPVIIDEVQRVPDLLSAIQVAVDRPEHTGNYVLNGIPGPSADAGCIAVAGRAYRNSPPVAPVPGGIGGAAASRT